MTGGLQKLSYEDPAMCRLVWIAKQDSSKIVSMLANNEIDSAVDLRPLAFQSLIENIRKLIHIQEKSRHMVILTGGLMFAL